MRSTNVFLPLRMAAICLTTLFFISCSSLPGPVASPAPPPPDPQVVPLSVLVTPTAKEVIPAQTRIVVANINGRFPDQADPCADAVKDALMRRLIENANYDVLSRDDLDWIFNEMENTWGGRFNTRTATKVGELLGASLFVVGRVGYCGLTNNTAPDSESPVQFSIFATLQIIDLATGRVVVSSAGDGNFVARSGGLSALLELPGTDEPDKKKEEKKEGDSVAAQAGEVVEKNAVQKANDWFKGFWTIDSPSSRAQDGQRLHPLAEEKQVRREKAEQYQVFKAAEDLANGFADNFFARPVWQTVEMWHDERWIHSEALHLVKLGDCPKALDLMENRAAQEIQFMDQPQMAQYLHNYGVVLMCSNHPDRAVDKLRSAYRLGYNRTTLRMLGLARKAQEWALRTEEDVQPEVDLLMKKLAAWQDASLK